MLDQSIDFEFALIYQAVEIDFLHYEIQLLNLSCLLSYFAMYNTATRGRSHFGLLLS